VNGEEAIMNSNTNFEEVISQSTLKFAEAAARSLEMMFSTAAQPNHRLRVTNGVGASDKNFFVSIFFTGIVYGEYVLAMNEETAAAIIGQTFKDKADAERQQVRADVTDAFSELLNLVVGESIVDLNKVYQKLTITPPRICFGSMSYPHVTTGQSGLIFKGGDIDCYLYIDRMKLDIASSYKEALSKVLVAHKELQEAMKKLQLQQSFLVQSEKMSALGTMAAGVAHEINTPLTTISMVGGNIKDIVNEEEFDRQKILTGLDKIEQTIARISKITNAMRDFANGVKNEKYTQIHVQDLINSALIVGEQRLKQENIKLIRDEAHGRVIECQAPQISQVILSLIHNSCDAITALPEKWIKIDVAELEDKIEIKLTDAGKGIPKDLRLKIFDPFFTTKDFGQGTGLGLSVAKTTIESQGGQIGIDTDCPNTCFFIRLPKERQAKSA
jgi:C4-dicarboxylate-specific signal transduction histidine kinase